MGLRNALARLETEREAGKRQLEASRARERKLRKDIAKRDAVVSSGERQLQVIDSRNRQEAALPSLPPRL